MSIFGRYSAYYDLLYQDKDYSGEADYVARTIRARLPGARRILELGSGTGHHGRLLAAQEFDVHGIERSAEMVAMARESARGARIDSAGSFTCEVGDLGAATLGRQFDAVISLFHVISYQATDDALHAAFRTAATHLVPGGLFLFDVWHGPAVLAQRPTTRVKEAGDERYRVTRTARPKIESDRSAVTVTYEFDCTDRSSGVTAHFSEQHLMRYLFPGEIDALARDAGFHVLNAEEFLTARPPSCSTWGVGYLLERLRS